MKWARHKRMNIIWFHLCQVSRIGKFRDRNRQNRGYQQLGEEKISWGGGGAHSFRGGVPFHFSLSFIGEGNGNPLQRSCLENPRNGGAWWAAIYGVAQSWTRLKRLSSSNSRVVNRRRQWHPTPVLLPGKSHGRRTLVGCSPWGR